MPDWSKSRLNMCVKRVAFALSEVLAFPNASNKVQIAFNFSGVTTYGISGTIKKNKI